MNNPALLLFCKRPELGYGKQRLAITLGESWAFEVSKLLLDCALEDFSQWQGLKILSPTSHNAEWAQALLSSQSISNAVVMPQSHGNMGERLNQVDIQARATLQFSSLIIIGSDAPTLTEELYKEAQVALCENDIVVTPAYDGGVTLMGARVSWPDLATLPWSHETLKEELFQLCQRNGLTTKETSQSYDIDTKEDLFRFYSDFQNDSRASRIALCAWIHKHLGIHEEYPFSGVSV